MKLKAVLRVLLFWLLTAIGFASSSGLFRHSQSKWSQHLTLLISIVFTLVLIPVFVKWERMQLRDVGIIPNRQTIRKVATGFLLGLVMTLFQLAFVYFSGHYHIKVADSFPVVVILNFLILYILVAVREESTFRSYPLFGLNHRLGLWPAQFIIVIIFSIEHIIGGMSWWQAFLGAGTGGLLFGLVAIRTKGIAFPTGLHTAWNFGQWCLGFKKEPGILRGIADKGFEGLIERNAWIGYFIIMAIAIVVAYFYKVEKRE